MTLKINDWQQEKRTQASCPTSDLYCELQLLPSADVRESLLFMFLHPKAVPKCRMKEESMSGCTTGNETCKPLS